MSRRIAGSLIVCALVSGCSIRGRFSIEPADASAVDSVADVAPDNGSLPDVVDEGAAPDVVGDVVADAQCGVGETACGGSCVDTQSDLSNCGACGTTCGAPVERASFACVAGTCTGQCSSGTYVPHPLERMLGTCEDHVRQHAPMSGSYLQGSVIEFRFTRTPDDRSTLRLCADSGCVGTPVVSRSLSNGSTSLSVTLAAAEVSMFASGVIFWRIVEGAYQSPIWSLRLIPNPVPAPTLAAEERRSRAAFGAGTDFTGDGLSDMVVSATREGRRQLLLLQAGVDPRMAPTVRGPYALPLDYRMGDLVTRIGDVNGDGYSDIAVNEQNHQAVFVFRGSPSGFELAPITIRRIAPAVRFGANITGGDLDGDGFGDLVVADDAAPPSGRGLVHVFWGGPNGPSAANTNPLGPGASPASGAQFGAGLESACDIDGDGKHDLLIGAPNAPGGVSGGTPIVYMFRGGSRALGGGVTRGPSNETLFGTQIGCLGDLDSDGDHEWVTETRRNGDMSSKLVIYPGANMPNGLPDIVRDMREIRTAPVLRFLPAYDMLQVMEGRGRLDITFLSNTSGSLSVHTHANLDGNASFGPVLGPVTLTPTPMPMGSVVNATVRHVGAGDPQLFLTVSSASSSGFVMVSPTVGGEFARPGGTTAFAALPMGLTNVGEVLLR